MCRFRTDIRLKIKLRVFTENTGSDSKFSRNTWDRLQSITRSLTDKHCKILRAFKGKIKEKSSKNMNISIALRYSQRKLKIVFFMSKCWKYIVRIWRTFVPNIFVKKMLSCVIPLFKEPEIIIPETGKKVFPEGPCKKYMAYYKLCIIG